MTAKDRYNDILDMLDSGDAAVVSEVVKDARADGRAEGHNQAVAELERIPLWFAVVTLVVGLGVGSWGGCAGGRGCHSAEVEGCYEKVEMNTSKVGCRSGCWPHVGRLYNEHPTDGISAVCECAEEDGVWRRTEME